MRSLPSALLTLVLLAGGARASDFTKDAIGTTGAEFLLMDQGARGIGMGGAYSAVTNDSQSLYWNPAGLNRIPRLSAGFMYSRFVEGISYQSASVAHRVTDIGVIAAGWRYRDAGVIDHTDISGTSRGTFHPRDYVAEVGWGQAVYDLSDSEIDIAMGVAARWIHSDYLLHANGYGGDIGIQSRVYRGSYAYDFAFVAQNMGLGQKFDQRRDTLPFRARFGAAMRPTRPLLVSLDGIVPANNVPHAALGLEYTLEVDRNIRAAARAGFNSLTVDSLGPLSTPSAGMGLTISDLTFDYAFVPFGVLGDSLHRFTVSYNLPAKTSRRYRQR